METINLFGASGHGKVVADIITRTGRSAGRFYDDNPACGDIAGCKVYKADETCVEGPMIISIGSNRIRKLISERYDVPYATAIHPGAIVAPSAQIGDGSVVMAGAIIEAEASIGKHCIINTGATLNHECRLEDFVHISPHATLCGAVSVGEGSWIGAGAVIIQGVRIGRWCTVGAGSVVLHDIPDGAKAYGNPCRIIE